MNLMKRLDSSREAKISAKTGRVILNLRERGRGIGRGREFLTLGHSINEADLNRDNHIQIHCVFLNGRLQVLELKHQNQKKGVKPMKPE